MNVVIIKSIHNIRPFDNNPRRQIINSVLVLIIIINNTKIECFEMLSHLHHSLASYCCESPVTTTKLWNNRTQSLVTAH